MEEAKGELVPGGLAMVYGLVECAHNNGLIVTTERLGVPGEKTPQGFTYGGSPDSWLCTSDSIVNNAGGEGFAYFFPRNLMPINPEADPLETTQEQEKCTHA